jgi:hypothetical protein
MATVKVRRRRKGGGEDENEKASGEKRELAVTCI